MLGLPLIFGPVGDDWGGFGRPGRRRLPERISWWPPGTSAPGTSWDLAYKILAGLGFFLPGVSQIVMLIRGLQPKTAQKWLKPKKAQTVREEPKKPQNWSGRSPKSSEMVHKMVG